mgnify:CR=1 FL=1
MLELNLQFFAAEGPGGEKTEEPTAKKKQDTRKDGKVAKSLQWQKTVMRKHSILISEILHL